MIISVYVGSLLRVHKRPATALSILVVVNVVAYVDLVVAEVCGFLFQALQQQDGVYEIGVLEVDCEAQGVSVFH